jgi:FkbM family methyltransferase
LNAPTRFNRYLNKLRIAVARTSPDRLFSAERKQLWYSLAQLQGKVVHDEDFNVFASNFALSKSIKHIVDVGANRGQSIISLRQVLPQAHIESFEANPLFYPVLEQLVLRYHGEVILHRHGLGAGNSHLDLYVPRVGKTRYLQEASIRPEYFSMPWVRQKFEARGKLVLDTIRVDIKRGDDLGLIPDLIKIDVEGAELDVVSGFIETIGRCRPILIVENSDYEAVSRLLQAMNYSAYKYDKAELKLVPMSGKSTNTLLYT